MLTKNQVIHELETVENHHALALVHQLILNLKNAPLTEKNAATHSKEQRQQAVDAFCGVFDGLPLDEVEDTLRQVRAGRRGQWIDR